MLPHACVVAVLIARGASAQTPTFAGCYALRLEPWAPSLGAAAAYHRVPSSIRLDSIPRGPGWAMSPDIDYPRDHAFPGTPRWEVVADTLVLMWSNGFSPTVVRLVARDGELVGDAVALSDAHPIPDPPRPRAVARARRTTCPR